MSDIKYDDWIPPKEAAARLKVSIDTIYNLIDAGEIRAADRRATGVGRRRRFIVDPTSIPEFLERRLIPPRPGPRLERERRSPLPQGIKPFV